jgi:uncharacterized protein (DUF1501 family)
MSLSLSRREWLRLAGVSVPGLYGWFSSLGAAAAEDKQRKRSCILLWMPGGPSQIDTFDPKPDHENGGPFKPLRTNVECITIGEHLPQLAKQADRLAIVRSMTSKEGDHGRATYQMRTGYAPLPPLKYPQFGSVIAKELAREDAELPPCVSIGTARQFAPEAYTPGYLGSMYAPLNIGESALYRPDENIDKALKVQDLALPADVSEKRADARIDLLRRSEKSFADQHPDLPVQSHQSAEERAVKLVRTAAGKAFDLDEEPAKLRDAYGRNLFGQGCLMARRLVERGVPFVEVGLSSGQMGALSWDTHARNFDAVKGLCGTLDPAWSTLMNDLQDRGLLDTTLIVWMGEFGRTPKINQAAGRDHWPNCYSAVLAGGGIKGGQVVGKTSKDGTTIDERPVPVADFLGTVCLALGIDPKKQNLSNTGRPIRLVDQKAEPLTEVVKQ